MSRHADDGSTIPLILGFFLVALIVVAGSVAAGDTFVQQRNLQSVCDGAAVAAAASAVDLNRTTGQADHLLAFAGAQEAVERYLSRDPSRASVRVAASLSPDSRTLTLSCAQTAPIAFGSFFGYSAGVHHTATSSAKAPTR
ncbi:MAG TPA: pilus assembly protein TadG-related protein [Jatrophihabitantaceae bacterium]|jgi:uncharacterized membrane protein|nr:pilus assembly protein TadG-related protein [Jatrophihabitantaceae bacterium]